MSMFLFAVWVIASSQPGSVWRSQPNTQGTTNARLCSESILMSPQHATGRNRLGNYAR